jgi:hypothetical protein
LAKVLEYDPNATLERKDGVGQADGSPICGNRSNGLCAAWSNFGETCV